MKNITTYIVEKLNKINSKTNYIDDNSDLRDIILHEDDPLTIIKTLIIYGLTMNIVNRARYKRLINKNQFMIGERHFISVELRNIITSIVFNVSMSKAIITYSDSMTIKRIKKYHKESLLDVFNMLTEYFPKEDKQITLAIQNGINEYIESYEKDK